jgi:hypothetical protein
MKVRGGSPMELAIIIILLAILFFGSDLLLRKWLNIKRVKLSETSAKGIDRWGRGVILIVAICFIPFTVGTLDPNKILWFWIVYLSVLTAFQAYLQWKYIRKSKEYILTLAFLPIGIAALLTISYLYY